MQSDSITIIGYNLFYYIDVYNDGHKFIECSYKGHELFGKKSNDTYISIKLKVTYGECYSGYTTASFGNIEVDEISLNDITKIKYLAKNHLILPESYLNKNTFKCNFCSYSSDGNDAYYPTGYYTVNTKFFRSVKRLNKKFVELIKDELLAEVMNPNRLEKLIIFCNKELKFLGRNTISTRDIIQNF